MQGKGRSVVDSQGRSKVTMDIKSQTEELSFFSVSGRESFKMF